MSEALFNSQEEFYCSDNELCSQDIEMAQVSDELYIFWHLWIPTLQCHLWSVYHTITITPPAAVVATTNVNIILMQLDNCIVLRSDTLSLPLQAGWHLIWLSFKTLKCAGACIDT